MYSYPYSYTHTYAYTPFFSFIVPVIAAIVVIAGGLALYFLFARKANHFQGVISKLHDALNFRTFYTEKILRALYCITVVAIAVYSVILLFTHFFTALMLFVLGNLIARIVYEYALLLLVLCRNTQEINRKMGPLPAEPPVPPAPGAAPAPAAAPQQPPVPPVNPQPSCPPQNVAPVPPQQDAPQQPPMPPQDGPQA